MGLEINLIKVRKEYSDSIIKQYPDYLNDESEDGVKIWDAINDNGAILDDILWCGRGSWLYHEGSDLGMLGTFCHPLEKAKIGEVINDAEDYLRDIESTIKNMSQLHVDTVRELLKEAEENGQEYIDFDLAYVNYDDVDPDDRPMVQRLVQSLKETTEDEIWWIFYSY